MVDSSSLVFNTGVNALVWAGYPGQSGGTAIINILTGKTAPAGRLPVTQYPVSCPGQLVSSNPNSSGQLRRRASNDEHVSPTIHINKLQHEQPRVRLPAFTQLPHSLLNTPDEPTNGTQARPSSPSGTAYTTQPSAQT